MNTTILTTYYSLLITHFKIEDNEMPRKNPGAFACPINELELVSQLGLLYKLRHFYGNGFRAAVAQHF